MPSSQSFISATRVLARSESDSTTICFRAQHSVASQSAVSLSGKDHALFELRYTRSDFNLSASVAEGNDWILTAAGNKDEQHLIEEQKAEQKGSGSSVATDTDNKTMMRNAKAKNMDNTYRMLKGLVRFFTDTEAEGTSCGEVNQLVVEKDALINPFFVNKS
ncbi:hypothetical protein BGZ51_000082 [Haplosporangium sp. Z 767]|nr:hypothetical protein BGZ51_000082 [Haplosporangium sp. Z 767]